MTVPNNNFYHWRLFPVACSTAATMLLLSFQSGAAEWNITRTLSVSETYSDNVDLDPSADAVSGFITQVTPGISVTGTGSHLKVDAKYGLRASHYSSGDNNSDIAHLLNANANAELVDDLFFVDAKASISQQLISAFGAQSTDGTNNNNNTTDVKTYSISPYLRHHFRNFADMETRFTHDSVSSGSGGMEDSTGDKINIRLTSGSDFSTLGWGLSFFKQRLDYSGQTNVNSGDQLSNSEKYSADLRYRLTPQFSLTGTGGYQKYDYNSIDGNNPQGSFWTAGFDWKPSQRTSIAANAGQMYTGNTYFADISHRARRTLLTLNYNQSVSTSRDQFLAPVSFDTASYYNQLWTSIIPDPVARQQAVEAYISANGLPPTLLEPVNFFSNQYNEYKTLRASVAFTGVRNNIVFSLFSSKTKALSDQAGTGSVSGPIDLQANQDSDQVGANALWNLRMSSTMDANLSATISRSTSNETDQQDDYKILRLGLTKKLLPKVNGRVELRHNEDDSNLPDNSYEENAVTASIQITF
jgi:uncharacterized protein (PEP-CTERM system associated)